MGLHAGIICLRVRNFGGGPSSSVVGPQASLVVPWLSGFFTSGVISLGLWAGCLVLCVVSLGFARCFPGFASLWFFWRLFCFVCGFSILLV